MDPRILVTGASGFVGGAIARAAISAGLETHGVSLRGATGPPGVLMHAANLLARDETRSLLARVRPTHIVHAAWDVTHGRYWAARTNLAWLAAGVSLVDDFFAAGGARAVGVGTCAEYQWSLDRYRETDAPLLPHSVYGRCKLALFHAYEAMRTYGGSTAWARLFFPFGPGDGQARFIPSLMAALRAGQTFDTTAGTQLRDFIHIDDVGSAMVALALSVVEGAINIGSGHATSLREVALTVAEVLSAPADRIRFGALPMPPGDPPALVADVSRLRSEVGFSAKFDLRQGLVHTAAAFGKQS